MGRFFKTAIKLRKKSWNF